MFSHCSAKLNTVLPRKNYNCLQLNNLFLQVLQRFIDESPAGVIYVSMGYNLRSCNTKNTTTKAFLDLFSKLTQRVLWKWKTDSLPGQPSTANLCKRLAQSDILGEFISLVCK